MKQNMRLPAYVFVIIGTLGLLANEFLFSWGTTATLLFATLSVIGFAALGVSLWRSKCDVARPT